jgi:hypothetical protein
VLTCVFIAYSFPFYYFVNTLICTFLCSLILTNLSALCLQIFLPSKIKSYLFPLVNKKKHKIFPSVHSIFSFCLDLLLSGYLCICEFICMLFSFCLLFLFLFFSSSLLFYLFCCFLTEHLISNLLIYYAEVLCCDQLCCLFYFCRFYFILLIFPLHMFMHFCLCILIILCDITLFDIFLFLMAAFFRYLVVLYL